VQTPQVRALVDEAACHTFCLADAGSDADAPWRLQTTVVTLRGMASVGAFQVQTLAADTTKLKVIKDAFERLAPADRRLLLERGVAVKNETDVRGANARVSFSHRVKPQPRPVRKDMDVALQLADASQQMKLANAALEALKASIRASWDPESKVEVYHEGAVKLCKAVGGTTTRVTYTCPGGVAAFERELSEEEQARVHSAFSRPDALLHVRGEAVGGGSQKRQMTVNSSGRALAVSFSAPNGQDSPARLPSHAYAARRGGPAGQA
jgi:hypothetical protein